MSAKKHLAPIRSFAAPVLTMLGFQAALTRNLCGLRAWRLVCARWSKQHDNNRLMRRGSPLIRGRRARPYTAFRQTALRKSVTAESRNRCRSATAPANSWLGGRAGPTRKDANAVFAAAHEVVDGRKPEPKYEAFPGVLNGGIIGTLLDCIATDGPHII